jgi:hypothetical protein
MQELKLGMKAFVGEIEVLDIVSVYHMECLQIF